MTDRLTLAHALEDANIERGAAERIATEINDAITANVATKPDLQQLEQRLGLRFAAIDTRFAEIGKVLSDAKAEIRNWMLAQTFAILAVVAVLHFVK